MKLTLERSYLPHCTLGVLHVPGAGEFATIERPWLNNKPNVSCIPEGVYQCVPHNGNKFKNVWCLENVVDRSAILIHVGNFVDDVIGCIAVGKTLSTEKYMVLNSGDAIDELRALLPEQFQIHIKTKQIEFA